MPLNPLMGGYGSSSQTSWLGQHESQYDSGAAMQQMLAQEQWDWQKKLYGEQTAASREAAGGISAMIDQYNQAYGEAKTANEQRYQNMLGIANQTTGQRAADVRDAYGRLESSMMQNLARTGMANTTVAPTMKMGVEREKQSSLNRLADEMQGTKLGIMERREDEYPQSDIILELVRALGQGGSGAGGTAIYNALSNLQVG